MDQAPAWDWCFLLQMQALAVPSGLSVRLQVADAEAGRSTSAWHWAVCEAGLGGLGQGTGIGKRVVPSEAG